MCMGKAYTMRFPITLQTIEVIYPETNAPNWHTFIKQSGAAQFVG